MEDLLFAFCLLPRFLPVVHQVEAKNPTVNELVFGRGSLSIIANMEDEKMLRASTTQNMESHINHDLEITNKLIESQKIPVA